MPSQQQAWDQVTQFMRKTCGVVLDAHQQYLLESRVTPFAKVHNFASVEDYVVAACSGSRTSPLAKDLVDALTTHESYFFRDDSFWQAFEQIVIPGLIAQKARSLRVWSAACSHGQEAYSLAILLEEKWPQLAESVFILGTDVSEPAVQRAAAGLYTSLEVNRGITAMRLVKHFEKAEGGFRVKPKLRSRISWQVRNLLQEPPTVGPFDIVLCRNVLIYFDAQDRKIAHARLTDAGRANGYIGLGTSEFCAHQNVAPGWFIQQAKGGTP